MDLHPPPSQAARYCHDTGSEPNFGELRRQSGYEGSGAATAGKGGPYRCPMARAKESDCHCDGMDAPGRHLRAKVVSTDDLRRRPWGRLTRSDWILRSG